MVDKYNQKKKQQLGMAFGTATGRLRKMILFQLVCETKKGTCFRCDKKIKNIDNLSIEHKIPWLDSESPVKLSFDLDNIAFSHLKCNIGSSRSSPPTVPCPSAAAYRRGCRCENCVIAAREQTKKDSRNWRRRAKGTAVR